MNVVMMLIVVVLVVRVVVKMVGVKVVWDMDDCITVGFVGKKDVVMEILGMDEDVRDWSAHDDMLSTEKVNKVVWCVYMVCVVLGVYNVVLSARGANNREMTVAWMRKRGMVWDEMVLREVEYEGMRSAAYKKEMVRVYGWTRVLVCVDDDEKNINAFKEMGMRGVVYGRMEVA